MAAILSRVRHDTVPTTRSSTTEPAWVRWLLILVTVGFISLFLVLPLAAVFFKAFEKGVGPYFATFQDNPPYAVKSILLTLKAAAIAVPANLVFGLAAAWAITKFRYKGKSLLVTVLDLPFAISPVIAGLIFILIFSRTHGWLGQAMRWEGPITGHIAAWLHYIDENIVSLKIIFAFPGIALATVFITLPFIARELVPTMQAHGRDEEHAALTLGASGWRTFLTVTLPNVRWALFYGIILCNARAMGEFGAVAVVSGNIRGQTTTMPLYIEMLYHGHDKDVDAFTLASLLALLALLTLVLKNIVEWRVAKSRQS
ncbi:MAG TPA: sulfate ABC transporter permease subunit CysW [Bacteroidia bacterium]|nr:sulfate ABC transporter permease subunit CysW [Bacteroidia bacterium]